MLSAKILPLLGLLAGLHPITAIAQFKAPPDDSVHGRGAWFCQLSGKFSSEADACAEHWLFTLNPALMKKRYEQAKTEAQASAQASAKAEKDFEEQQAKETAARQEQEQADIKRRTLEMAAQQKRFADQRDAQQKEEQVAEDMRKAAISKQEAEDTSNGYARSTMADFILDYKTLPDGSKLSLYGLHLAFGDSDILSDGYPGNYTIHLDMSNLSRDTRKRVMACHEAGSAYCRMTIWAHTGCSVSFFGNETSAPCLIVDGLRGGTYEHPMDGPVLR